MEGTETKRKTNLAFHTEVYKLLKMASFYKLKDMTDIVETAVIEYFINHKDEFPDDIKKQIDEMAKKFFPDRRE